MQSLFLNVALIYPDHGVVLVGQQAPSELDAVGVGWPCPAFRASLAKRLNAVTGFGNCFLSEL